MHSKSGLICYSRGQKSYKIRQFSQKGTQSKPPATETTLFLHVFKVRVGGTSSISALKILDVFLYEIKMNNIISIYKYFKSLR